MGKRGEPKAPEATKTDTTKMTEEEKMAFCREVAILKKIMHPYCCRLYEVLDDANDDNFYMGN